MCFVLGGGSLAVAWTSGLVSPVHEFTANPLAWNSRNWATRPWTLWTSAWVHTSGGSLGGNLLALAGLTVLGAALDVGSAAAAALAVAWPGMVCGALCGWLSGLLAQRARSPEDAPR